MRREFLEFLSGMARETSTYDIQYYATRVCVVLFCNRQLPIG